jgi:penicillin G amidase
MASCRPEEMPKLYNPPSRFIATANHNILPEDYPHQLSFEWALPFRYTRLQQALSGRRGWDRIDFQRLQQDVLSLPARRFQSILRQWNPAADSQAGQTVAKLLAWDAQMRVDSEPGLIYQAWLPKLSATLFGAELGARVNVLTVLRQPGRTTGYLARWSESLAGRSRSCAPISPMAI